MLALTAEMTYEQAMSYLGATADTDDEGITVLETAKVADDATSEDQAREAVRVIAEYKKSDYLLNHLAGTAPPQLMEVNRAHRLLGVDVGGQFDAQHLITQFEMNSKDQPERSTELREALEVVAASTKSEDLRNYIQTLSPANYQQLANQPVDEPRGLNNIGNTCYLASLLQYLYTIQPVRELVRNVDQYAETLQEAVELMKKVDDAPVSKAQVKRALQCECRFIVVVRCETDYP